MQNMKTNRGSGQGNRIGMGVGGYCICPDCGYKESHKRGTPCFELKCPKCKKSLVREG